MVIMSDNTSESLIKKKYQDLCLDLNLDKATADDAWECYEKIKSSYTLEGDQLPWLACALYSSCRKRSIPTVGGRPGNMIQGNCVSLTRMLQHCSLPLTDFIMKMKSWLAMSHCDEAFCRRIELLERNFAVSSNIFKAYQPIFLDLFQDPSKDPPRPPRSRKQRRPQCNSTELFNFCWTLYICIKGKYPSIPQDLVSCFSLLLSCVDLLFTNVIISGRKDLLNPLCEGLPPGILEHDGIIDLASYPVSIMDYLCKKFECVVLDTKVVRDYYWKVNIKDLVEQGTLKGTKEGTGLIEQTNFDHNSKEIKNCYEEYLLSCGEFDERMFLNDPQMVKGMSRVSSPNSKSQDLLESSSTTLSNSNTPLKARCNLSQTFERDKSDHHLIQQTPITGRQYTVNRPVVGNTPLSIVTTGLHKLYALMSGRKNSPGAKLLEIFGTLHNNPEERITYLIGEMSESFTNLYSKATEDYTAPNLEFTKMRLQTGQILYYTFLEHILVDEQKRKVDLEAILKEDLFHKTLFVCCIEIVLKSYNDARRFPWSLQVGNVDAYYFMRIIEPVIRSEKQSENQLSRELVKHLKGIEEQILDSLAWQRESPLWQILKDTDSGVPSCQDVNFSHHLEPGVQLTPSLSLPSSSIMSPAIKIHKDVLQSPLSSNLDRFSSPNGSARRMLFPTATSMGPSNMAESLKLLQPKTLKPSSLQPVSLVDTTCDQQNAAREATVDSFLQSPLPVQSSEPHSAKQDSKKDKPRRHGSLALFFRKFYTLGDMRLRDLCDRLDIRSAELRQQIWTCFEHSIIHYTDMMTDRHMDQMIMCAVYITCKVTGEDKIFQEIMKHYRSQPQAASHVYRSVLITRNCSKNIKNESPELNKNDGGPPPTPSQMRGTSAQMASGERGDLIKFYNLIYVKTIRNFALKFRKEQQGDLPRLSPLPIVRTTPVSPRRRISNHHSVFINALNFNSPMKGNTTTLSPRPPLPYFFNRSPAKDLRVINNMVKSQCNGTKRLLNGGGELDPKMSGSYDSFGGVKKRMLCVLEHHQPSPSPCLVNNSSIEQPLNFNNASSDGSIRGLITNNENVSCLQTNDKDYDH